MKPSTHKPAVLVFPFDLLSHYVRCLLLAEAIRDQHELLFAHSKKYAWLVERAGFETFACEGFDAAEVMVCARRFDFSWINEASFERVLLSQVACIRRHRPVAVIGDTAPTLKMASEKTGVRHLALMNGYMTNYYALTRKISSVHPMAGCVKMLPQAISDRLIRKGEQIAFRQLHKPYARLRQKFGLQVLHSYVDEQTGDDNLICDLPEFFPQENLPQNYHFVGPLFYAGTEAEPEIERFLSNGKHSILVNKGSSGDPEKLAFLNRPNFQKYNIVAAGDPNGYLRGRHIFSKPFINNAAILDRIDLVICHGGNGSIYQALAFGVPLLCLPSIFEQEWNVQRVVDLRLGATLAGIMDRTQIADLIDHWICQKNKPFFEKLRAKITLEESKNKFRKFWNRNGKWKYIPCRPL